MKSFHSLLVPGKGDEEGVEKRKLWIRGEGGLYNPPPSGLRSSRQSSQRIKRRVGSGSYCI